MNRLSPELVQNLRGQFPALGREIAGKPAVFFDGPAGTQVPQTVIDAIVAYLRRHNANHGGNFQTSRESDEALRFAHQAVADFVGADDSNCVCFGPNMTTLTFALSRALAKQWQRGDEIIVTLLDHDANVTPWVMAARDAGATVHYVDIHPKDASLDLDDLRTKLSHRTRMVAVACASNATGGLHDVASICRWAHDVGALVFVDAVHYAPHGRIDVDKLGCDFLACSAYKFFGPHVGILWGRREVLESTDPYKVRPAPESLPGKWMTGTQNHEGIVGVTAAIDYVANVGRSVENNDTLDRRSALAAAFDAIGGYERSLSARFLGGIREIPSIRIIGVSDEDVLEKRVPTFSVVHADKPSTQLACELGERGIFVWHGNYYALNLSEVLGHEPDGMVRIGMVHYNTIEEVDRLVSILKELS